MTTRYQESHYADVARILRLEHRDGMLTFCPEHREPSCGDEPWEQCHDPIDHVRADGAEAPGECRCPGGQSSIQHRFADLFSTDTHQFTNDFDRARFLAACGLESEEDTGCAACGGDLDIDVDIIDDAKGEGQDGRLSGIHRRCT